ncbi:MAG: hypothetical protein O6934_01500 [SAR324 cluster bacterium]|nr:hypothetical protein [SAR324 cluster bacterium]MCZ6729658.1 hypothetical protein [SAR324 cluster bacterium]
MIPKQLKANFHTGEPVIKEFAALMNLTFKYYADTRSLFFDRLPTHLHQSELISLINVDLKNRLFNKSFCETIEEALKALRRVIVRLEDLRRDHPDVSNVFDNIGRLGKLAGRVEALYQHHWEHYRYRNQLSEADLVSFVLEIDGIGREWENLQTSHSSLQALVGSLSGRACPEGLQPLVISYQRKAPEHFATETLKALMNFFEVAYRFVCTVCELDHTVQPLTLLQVEVAEPVELHLAVPEQIEPPFRTLLQHLFLKDMFKPEALLKFVFEAIQKDFGEGRTLPAPALAAFQRQLNATVKQLPQDGSFTISGRTFPEMRLQVLKDLTDYMDRLNMKYEGLLKAVEKPKDGAKSRAAAQPKPPPEARPEPPPKRPSPEILPAGENPKEHIRILTDRTR